MRKQLWHVWRPAAAAATEAAFAAEETPED